MTEADANAYAEREYQKWLFEFTSDLPELLVRLIKNRLAVAYIEGGRAMTGSQLLNRSKPMSDDEEAALIPVCKPVTATVNQPQSEEWSSPCENQPAT
jgi:hypothetical protein